MKQKLKNALINKYKKLGYSHKAIDAVVSHLEKSVTKEEEIDEAIEGVEDLLKAFQSEIDSRVAKALKDKEDEKGDEGEEEEGGAPADPKGKPKKEKTEPNKPNNDEVPAWAKSLIESNKTLTEKLSKLESGKTSESRKKTLEEKLKDANPVFKNATLKAFGRMKFDTEEEFDEYLAEVEADMGEHEETEVQENLSALGKPQKSGGKKTKEASKEEIASVVNEIMP